jgi:hypothetical protein
VELEKAKEVLNQAIDGAFKAGVYNLGDADLIVQALKKINSLDDIEFKEVNPFKND